MIEVSLSSLFYCLALELSHIRCLFSTTSLCLLDMNTRTSNSRRKEGGVDNERIHPYVDQVPLVGLYEENEEDPLQEPQVPPEPQEPQVISVSYASSSFC